MINEEQPPPVRFPWRLSVPGFALLLSLLPFLFEQWGNQQWWWNKVPWLELLAFAVGLVLGAIYALVASKQSDLREWWRTAQGYFRATVLSRSKNDGTKEWFELTAQIRFTKTVSDVAIELFARDCVGSKATMKPKLVTSIPARGYSKDQTVDVAVACIPHYLQQTEPRRHALWGPVPGDNILRNGQHTIAPDSDNIGEIRVRKGQAVRTFRVFFAMIDRRDQTGGAFYFVPETRKLFD